MNSSSSQEHNDALKAELARIASLPDVPEMILPPSYLAEREQYRLRAQAWHAQLSEQWPEQDDPAFEQAHPTNPNPSKQHTQVGPRFWLGLSLGTNVLLLLAFLWLWASKT